MLNCREVTSQADALLEGELSWYPRLQVRLHLAMCRHCRRFVSQMRLLRAALRRRGQPGAVEITESQVDRIVARMPLPPSGTRQD